MSGGEADAEDLSITIPQGSGKRKPGVKIEGLDAYPQPSTYALRILSALQHKAHVYAGTVSPKVKERRRARAKVAKRQRKQNRSRG